MTNKHLLIQLILLFPVTLVHSQQTYQHTTAENLFRKGVELYQNGRYSAAQQFFDQYASIHAGEHTDFISESSFYGSMCALHLFNKDAEARARRFLDSYPESIHKIEMLFALAGYFYQGKNYSDALDCYRQVQSHQLRKEDQPEFFFKSGHCYFLADSIEKAKILFARIKDTDTKLSIPALYYYSHICYLQSELDEALSSFLRLQHDASFGPIVPYYLTQIYFRQKNYEEVVRLAPSLMENVTEKRGPEVARMIGESYAQLNLFEESIPYLEKFFSQTSGTSQDKYSLAYAYYKTGKYAQAAEWFGQITGDDSPLSQNALYHMADCQLKLHDKKKARMAFASASKMPYDPIICEDALYNFALLTYELDYTPFNEAVQALNDYLSKYPDSKRKTDAAGYLVLAYMNAKNYSLALSSIEKIPVLNPEMKKVYQKIAYYRGLELYSNQQYSEAVSMLTSSVKYGVSDGHIYALSLYWKGEAHYKMGAYDLAASSYNSFIDQPGDESVNEFSLAHYSLGYIFFNQKQYPQAASWFIRYLARPVNQHAEITVDANNRLGDCYFAQSDYNRAIQYYERAQASGKPGADYALLQKGIATGITGNHTGEIDILNRLLIAYPQTTFKVDALFHIAESQVRLNQNEKAIASYRKVVQEYPQSSYVKKALLSLGVLNYNQNRKEEAIASYKKVIEDYPGTEEASNALVGLKNVYVDHHDVEGYFQYLNDKGVITSADLIEEDSLSYVASEKLYMTGDYSRALKGLDNYINKHPDGLYILNAYFYKGDCHYRNNEYTMAREAFDQVIAYPRNKFTEQALLGAARVSFRLKDYTAAAMYYEKLAAIAETRSHVLEARLGMVECYSMLQNNSRVVELAEVILKNERCSPEQERKTRFAYAKALSAMDRPMLALEQYRKIAGDVKSLEGAESKYRVAEIYYQQKELNMAEKTISDFADKTTPHPYWMAKSFLLWADIYADRGDVFQASQTLQSLIDYYQKSEDGILEEAKSKKQQLMDGSKKNQPNQPADEEEILIGE